MDALEPYADVLKTLPQQIVFAVFDAESFDYMGSRRFVKDVQSFKCKKKIKAADKFVKADTGCWEPYQQNLNFMKLNMSKISGILEVKQVGSRDSGYHVYGHQENTHVPSSARRWTASVIDAMAGMSTEVGQVFHNNFQLSKANDTLPGVPPSSLWSFLKARPSIPAVLIADHDDTYTNQYYHSMYDDRTNVNDEQVTLVATLLARTLYTLASQEPSDTPSKDPNSTQFNATIYNSIKANDILVENLLSCLTTDMNCDLVASYDSYANESTTHYTSTFSYVESTEIAGTSRFVGHYLADKTKQYDRTKAGDDGEHGECDEESACAIRGMVCGKKKCVNSNTYFHSALDPVFTLDMTVDSMGSSGAWRIDHALVKNSSSRAWTESNWINNIGARFYRREEDSVVVTTLLCGFLVFLLSFVLTWKAQAYCKQKFKLL